MSSLEGNRTTMRRRKAGTHPLQVLEDEREDQEGQRTGWRVKRARSKEGERTEGKRKTEKRTLILWTIKNRSSESPGGRRAENRRIPRRVKKDVNSRWTEGSGRRRIEQRFGLRGGLLAQREGREPLSLRPRHGSWLTSLGLLAEKLSFLSSSLTTEPVETGGERRSKILPRRGEFDPSLAPVTPRGVQRRIVAGPWSKQGRRWRKLPEPRQAFFEIKEAVEIERRSRSLVHFRLPRSSKPPSPTY